MVTSKRPALTAAVLAVLMSALLAVPIARAITTGSPSTAATDLKAALRNSVDPSYNTRVFGANGSFTALAASVGGADPGTPSVAYLTIVAANPSDTNTLTIDGQVYEFSTAAGSLAADTRIGIVIAATSALTLVNLVNAINGDVTVATGLFMTDGVTPALRNGTKLYVADDLGSSVMRMRSASSVGGDVVCRADTAVLAETFTSASDIWDVGSGNAINAGRAPSKYQFMSASRTVTASHVAFLRVRVSFSGPYGPVAGVSRAIVQVKSSAGVVKYPIVDSYSISGSDVIYVLQAGGVAPEAIAGDVITVWAAVGP